MDDKGRHRDPEWTQVMSDEQRKGWIDNASYQELLQHWRYASVGDPFFQGEIGHYYKNVMSEKRSAISPARAVEASKAMG